MNILVSNDDGINSQSLLALAEAMSDLGNVYVAAPASQRSSASNSISIRTPLQAEKIHLSDKITGAWAIHGTPADCTKVALEAIYADIEFDLLISGINYGPNLGTDVFYSGTVGAAFEGYLLGIPAMAVSVNSFAEDYNYQAVAEFCCKFALWWQSRNFKPHVLFNINSPTTIGDKIDKISFARLGRRTYTHLFNPDQQQTNAKEISYFMTGKPKDDLTVADSDLVLIKEGYTTITPLWCDMTDQQAFTELKDLAISQEIFKK